MATLTIKNVPDNLYQDLKRQAITNHRSINKETIVILEQVIHGTIKSSREILLNARSLRIGENTAIQLTDDIINNAKQQGRL